MSDMKDDSICSDSGEELHPVSQIISNMAEGIFLARVSNLTIVYANPKCEEMFGYDSGELVGVHISILNMPGTDHAATADEVRQAVTENGSWTGEFYSIKKDGTPFWSLATASIYEHHKYGAIYLAVRTDITERKKAEEALRESENRLRSLIDFMPDIVIFKDENGRWMEANDFSIKVFNLQDVSFKGKSNSELADCVPFFKEALLYCERSDMKTWDGGVVFRGKEVLPQPNDDPKVFDVIKVPFYNEDGTRKALLVVGRDITEREKVEQKLTESEEKFRNAFEHASVGMTLMRLDTGFIQINKAFCQMTGYTSEELLEKTFTEITHPEDVEEGLENIEQLIAGEVESFQFTKRYLHKSERLVWALLDVSTVKDNNDEPLFMIAQVQDVTERKKAEEELKRSYVEKGEVLKELKKTLDVSANLTMEAQHARDEAESATKLKDKFVSLVSHDLKSPLSTMLGFLQLLSEDVSGTISEEGKVFLSSAIKSGKNMAKLIDELLSISRLKSGRMVTELSFFDAHYLALNAMLDFQFMADRKGINLLNNIKEGARIYADSTLLYEVLQNLVSNAVKFCGKGDTVTISTASDNPASIVVSDTGPGVKPELLKTIFSYEEKTSTVGTGGETGTGFGLPLSKDIVEAHGGSIEVKSTDGKGSVFLINLPMVKPRVLIVDDEEDMRILLEAYLRQLDVVIVGAQDGEEALKKIKEQPPHLILTDIKMPRLNGCELIEAVRSNAGIESIPIVVITANNEMEMREKVLRLGADDFIKKPIDLSEFTPRVKRFIS